jgi:hypothetical protein
MCLEIPPGSEGFTDMARPSIFSVQLDGFVVQHILYMDDLNVPANHDDAMELTRIEEHISQCGGSLVDLERMSR